MSANRQEPGRPVIAVATDFSEPAERARLAAVALARRIGASIALIHAVEPELPELEDTDRVAEARRRMAPIADAVRAAGVDVEVELPAGYAEECVAIAARRLGALVLAVGTHGHRAPLRWLLGSVAEGSLRSSELPVLVLGAAGDGFTAWSEARPLAVTVALESAVPPPALLAAARLLRRAGPCRLRFILVASRALMAGRLPSLLERSFRATAAELGATLQLVPEADSLAAAVVGDLAQHPSDVTVVGVHPRAGLENGRTAELARALVRHRVGAVLGVPLALQAVGAGASFAHILAATDLSELGNRAVARAYALAGSATITLVHVHVVPPDSAGGLDPEQRANLELALLALVPADAQSRGLRTDVVIVEAARPADALVDAATRLGCDVVCMGSHGHSALGRAVLGSVAADVLQRFAGAVLIVR